MLETHGKPESCALTPHQSPCGENMVVGSFGTVFQNLRGRILKGRGNIGVKRALFPSRGSLPGPCKPRETAGAVDEVERHTANGWQTPTFILKEKKGAAFYGY